MQRRSHRRRRMLSSVLASVVVVTVMLGGTAAHDLKAHQTASTQRFTGVGRAYAVGAGAESEQVKATACGDESDADFVLVSADHIEREEEALCSSHCVEVTTSGGSETLRVRGWCHECESANDLSISADAFSRLVVLKDAKSQSDMVAIEWTFAPCHARQLDFAGANATRVPAPVPGGGTGSSARPRSSATPLAVPRSTRPPALSSIRTPTPSITRAPVAISPSPPRGSSTSNQTPSPTSIESSACSSRPRATNTGGGSRTPTPSCGDNVIPAASSTPHSTPLPLPPSSIQGINTRTPDPSFPTSGISFATSSPRPSRTARSSPRTSSPRSSVPEPTTGDTATTGDNSAKLSTIGAATPVTTSDSSLSTRPTPTASSPIPSAASRQNVAQKSSRPAAGTDEEPYVAPRSGSSTSDASKSSRDPITSNSPSAATDSTSRRETLLKNPFFLFSVLLAAAGVIGFAVAYRAKGRRQQRHATQHAAWAQYSQRVQAAAHRNRSVGTRSSECVRDAYVVSSTARHGGRGSNNTRGSSPAALFPMTSPRPGAIV